MNNHKTTILACCLLSACRLEVHPLHQYPNEEEIDEPGLDAGQDAGLTPPPDGLGGVGRATAVHLPFVAGQSRLCVQGAFDSFSHNAYSTRYDLDFDTSNTSHEELYVPVRGVAYVHQENPDDNFGRHVNIDLGDGTYYVIAHFHEIFLHDGEPVAPGQLMGLEGCTGYCTGDHVHMGRHRGSARQEAQHGESIAMDVLIGEDEPLASESFVCGLEDGEWYGSVLQTACSHPNGTLIKSGLDPKTYLLADRQKRWIVDQEVFWSHGWDFADVILVAERELQAYPTGPEINQMGQAQAVYDEHGDLWLLLGQWQQDNISRQRVGSLDRELVLRSWGLTLSDAVEYHADTDQMLSYWPAYQGWATFRDGTLLKEVSRSDVYVAVDGAAVPIEDWPTFLRLGYRADRIMRISDQSIGYHFNFVGSCASSSQTCIREGDLYQCAAMNLAIPRISPLPEEPIDSEPESDAGAVFVADAGFPPESDAGQPDTWSPPEPDASVPDTSQPDTYIEPLFDASWPDTTQPDAFVEPPLDAGQPDSGFESGPDASQPDTAAQPDQYAEPPPDESRTLHVRWVTPFAQPVARITLSGEYTFSDGSLGFFWHELKSVYDISVITYDIPGVLAGDNFRFSVEFEDQDGHISWSCIGPYVAGTSQQGTRQGSATAHVDNQSVAVHTTGDPTGQTTGCGLIVYIP